MTWLVCVLCVLCVYAYDDVYVHTIFNTPNTSHTMYSPHIMSNTPYSIHPTSCPTHHIPFATHSRHNLTPTQNTHELIPGGSNIAVTAGNVLLYIHCMAAHVQGQVSAPIEAFAAGLRTVCCWCVFCHCVFCLCVFSVCVVVCCHTFALTIPKSRTHSLASRSSVNHTQNTPYPHKNTPYPHTYRHAHTHKKHPMPTQP